MEKYRIYFEGLERLFSVLDFVQIILWILIWYIVYYLWKHRCVFFLIAGNAIYLLLWLYEHRYLVTERPSGPIEHDWIVILVLNIAYKISSLCMLIGAVGGFRLLQKLLGEKLVREKSD
ncbi:MAG: hypothetical protein NTY53_25910 [Kiritimatiellaeota bacterium]|nr:hypothetical protein [Kiritimatiellota bacterium]